MGYISKVHVYVYSDVMVREAVRLIVRMNVIPPIGEAWVALVVVLLLPG